MTRTTLALLLLLPLGTSCLSTNLSAWADTRLDSPAEEQLRGSVAVLFIIPAILGDGVLLPLQLAGGFFPYGDLMEPDPDHVRHRTAGPATARQRRTQPTQEWKPTSRRPEDNETTQHGEYVHTGPRGSVDPDYERWRAKQR